MTSLIVDKSVKLDEKDVYGTVDQQLLFVKINIQFWDLREEMLDNLKTQKNADQSDQSDSWQQTHQLFDNNLCCSKILHATIIFFMDFK